MIQMSAEFVESYDLEKCTRGSTTQDLALSARHSTLSTEAWQC